MEDELFSLFNIQEDKNLDVPELSEEALKGIYATAYCFYQNGKYREASRFFRFLSIADANDPRHWIGLGATQQMLKEYEKAIESYTFAAILDEKNPYVYFHTADCLFALGKIDLGLKCLDSVEQVAKGQEKYEGLVSHVDLIRQNWENQKIK